MGREFKNAGNPSFPYLDRIDSLHFRDRDEIQHMRNVIRDLRPKKDKPATFKTELAQLLTQEVFVGDKNENLKEDVEWRINDHFGDDLDFWNLARSDIPMELSERVTSRDDGPLRTEYAGHGPLDGSILASRVPQYQGAHLVVSPFRIFHREDGAELSLNNDSM
jgi:hypothetical protein